MSNRYKIDAISLDGFECAGHPGEEDTGNFILQAMVYAKVLLSLSIYLSVYLSLTLTLSHSLLHILRELGNSMFLLFVPEGLEMEDNWYLFLCLPFSFPFYFFILFINFYFYRFLFLSMILFF